VHVAQRVEQLAPLKPRAQFSLRAFTGPARQARRGVEFDLVTEAHADGTCVWRGITTALSLGATGAPTPVARPDAAAPADAGPWQVIAQLAAPESLGRRYAAIAGDLNPIHQHALLARPFGFERAIVHGTWTLARALAAAGWPTTPAFELEARFRRPVLLPSTIEVMARRTAQGRELLVSGTERGTPHLQARLLRAEL
jgi:acyl dehydratase